MDIRDVLRQAVRRVPDSVVADGGVTAADVGELLDQDEWEVVLEFLIELGEAYPADPSWWDLLAEAARQLWLDRVEAWCLWRRYEAVHGVIRADLRLVPSTAPGGRRLPVPARGVLRPLWDIGDVTAAGHPDLYVARIWVEDAPELPPGGRGTVRLAPLSPERWRRLAPGDVITMHEQAPVAGTATILEASFTERAG
ncbi:hypothetical protein [Thermomonospora catenispora]|uniref:hypothetical protein n=1 Tax=Thermomonospora catenispora TaxID=2493090 RepID=UPI00111EEF1B|nr:hypothetical protein [Thermomonospora catenispora]TNY37848.1 hypothetical protein EIO00_06765 [Thermomonospora catenispora]